MTGFPIGGLVPFRGQVVDIKYRRRHGEHAWTYVLHTKSKEHGLEVHAEVPHAVILAEIGGRAHYNAGQTLALWGGTTVLKRAWSFRKGEIIYTLGNPRMKYGALSLPQDALFQRMRAEDAPDTPEDYDDNGRLGLRALL
jgi:hypothetical protein